MLNVDSQHHVYNFSPSFFVFLKIHLYISGNEVTAGKFYASFLIQDYFKKFRKRKEKERKKKGKDKSASLQVMNYDSCLSMYVCVCVCGLFLTFHFSVTSCLVHTGQNAIYVQEIGSHRIRTISEHKQHI